MIELVKSLPCQTQNEVSYLSLFPINTMQKENEEERQITERLAALITSRHTTNMHNRTRERKEILHSVNAQRS